MNKTSIIILVIVSLLVLCCCTTAGFFLIARSASETNTDENTNPIFMNDSDRETNDNDANTDDNTNDPAGIEESELPNDNPAQDNTAGSRGDQVLQEDVAKYLITNDQLIGGGACENANVEGVTFIEYQVPVEFDQNNRMVAGEWTEEWVINRCGDEEVTYIVSFSADGVGGTYYSASLLSQ